MCDCEPGMGGTHTNPNQNVFFAPYLHLAFLKQRCFLARNPSTNGKRVKIGHPLESIKNECWCDPYVIVNCINSVMKDFIEWASNLMLPELIECSPKKIVDRQKKMDLRRITLCVHTPNASRSYFFGSYLASFCSGWSLQESIRCTGQALLRRHQRR